jgi:hypothetical protein
MNRAPILLLSAAAALCAACTGCGGAYRAETVLHADGSIDRAIYQPYAHTPEAARRPGFWKQVTFAPKPEDLEKQAWPEALALLPVHGQDEKHPYFAAWNHFASVKDIPDHVRFKAPEKSGLPDGRLERDLTRMDLGLVEDYDWRETLTDCVTLEDMHKARAELADLLIDYGRDVFTEVAGKEYDLTDLVNWAKADGRDWFYELTDLVFLHAAAEKGPNRDKAVLAAIRASLDRHGVKLPEGAEPFADPASKKALDDFAVGLLADKVKKDGKPVGRETAQKWWDELNSKDGGRFAEAGKKVAERKYGGEKPLGDRVGLLALRIIGLYAIAGTWDFHYVMTFPGPVVQTNGELLGDGSKVLWHFHASDAYPLGYPMTARALRVPDEARKLIGRDKPLSDRDAVAAYADAVRDVEPLAETLRRCRKEMTLDPLYDFIAGRKTSKPDEAARAEKVLKLLKAS